ncbi:MAG: type II toxin-antitoxin system RelE/ParE family toxin [Candidatus Cloacimonetes bacterium]|nr:type II toxin-antitoxin system RelE/ParE family toxin [Candidatus Cloacimonadota bacterium]
MSSANNSSEIQVLQTSLFVRQKKKLRKNQLVELDKAVEEIVKNPNIGEQKKGDLKNIWVYKFRAGNNLYLLAYKWDKGLRILIALGTHENFYRDLKRYKKRRV